MSNKYEREIEEILRKMDDGHPPSVSERLRAIKQQPTRLRPGTTRTRVTMRPEGWLLTGFVLAFLAEIVHWVLRGSADLDPAHSVVDLAIGIAVVAGLAIIILTFVISWVNNNRAPQAGWRGNTLNQGGRGPHRGPFSNLRARWNLMRLRMSYRRRNH
jgi:hypothetical protein